MKTPLRTLLFALPLSLAAAPSDSLLVLGKSSRVENGRMIFTGAVSIVSKTNPDKIEVTADEIVFEQEAGRSILKCSGRATITIGARTVRGDNLIFDFADTSGNIYLLNPNGIVFGATADVVPAPFSFSGFNTQTGILPAKNLADQRVMTPAAGTVLYGQLTSDISKPEVTPQGDQPLPKFDSKPALMPAKP